MRQGVIKAGVAYLLHVLFPLQSTTNVAVVQPAAVTTTAVTRCVGDHYYNLSILMAILCCVCGGWWTLLCTLPAIAMASAVSVAIPITKSFPAHCTDYYFNPL